MKFSHNSNIMPFDFYEVYIAIAFVVGKWLNKWARVSEWVRACVRGWMRYGASEWTIGNECIDEGVNESMSGWIDELTDIKKKMNLLEDLYWNKLFTTLLSRQTLLCLINRLICWKLSGQASRHFEGYLNIT